MAISPLKFFFLSLSLFFTQAQGFCIDLDYSVDAEINRRFNPDVLERSLNGGMAKIDAPKIPKGTKFKAISKTAVSDGAKGKTITFTTTKPVTKRYITIPSGSTIQARVVNSHLPQYGGNGGLIKIEIESITVDGGIHSTDGKVTKANGKHIFFNNIKGKRKYASGIVKNCKASTKIYQKCMKKTGTYASDGLTMILSPFTFIGGVVVLAGGVLISPITALNTKGSRISIPADSPFELKLTKDMIIYN